MRFPISIRRTAELVRAPEYNVAATWPSVEDCLAALGVTSSLAYIAAIATIRVECPPFKPIREYGTRAYITHLYWDDQRKAHELGNLSAEDAWNYRGAGLIQLTGRDNFSHYGKLIGVDLVTNPDAALQIGNAARIFADYFHERKVHVAAERRDWKAVRRAVNGGQNGWMEFINCINTLEAELAHTNQVAAH
jgi:hypothetical protein